MSTVIFDTPKFVGEPGKTGLPRTQAAAIVDTRKVAFSEAAEKQLASRQDILKPEKQIGKIETALHPELADIRKEQVVRRGMMTVGGIVAPGVRAFFSFRTV